MADQQKPIYAKEEECTAYFEPRINADVEFPSIEVTSGEEEELELFKIRTKLFRFEDSAGEWRERGFGDVRLLEHPETKMIRVVMRRDTTLKICANHFVFPTMELTQNAGSERAWMYYTPADMTDVGLGETDESSAETLCFRFRNVEAAAEFKEKFEEAKVKMTAVLAERKAAADAAPAAAEEQE